MAAGAGPVSHGARLVRRHPPLRELLQRHFTHELVEVEATRGNRRWHALLSVAGMARMIVHHAGGSTVNLISGQRDVCPASVCNDLKRRIRRHCYRGLALSRLKALHL